MVVHISCMVRLKYLNKYLQTHLFNFQMMMFGHDYFLIPRATLMLDNAVFIICSYDNCELNVNWWPNIPSCSTRPKFRFLIIPTKISLKAQLVQSSLAHTFYYSKWTQSQTLTNNLRVMPHFKLIIHFY